MILNKIDINDRFIHFVFSIRLYLNPQSTTKTKADVLLLEEQMRFKEGRSTTDVLFAWKRIKKERLEFRQETYCFCWPLESLL